MRAQQHHHSVDLDVVVYHALLGVRERQVSPRRLGGIVKLKAITQDRGLGGLNFEAGLSDP